MTLNKAPGRFCGGSQEAREGNSLKSLLPPQPQSSCSTGHNILKQIIQNCIVDSPRDILNGISTKAKSNQDTERKTRCTYNQIKDIFSTFLNSGTLEITDCHLQKS